MSYLEMQTVYDIAVLLRETRHRLGLSQSEMSKALKVPEWSLWAWESDRCAPSLAFRQRLAAELEHLAKSMKPKKNWRIHSGRKPGPGSIWYKLPPVSKGAA